MPKRVNKLAVFDMDGTLYTCNSHMELLNQVYGRRIFDSFAMKVYGKLFGKRYLKLLNDTYERVPKEFIEAFKPEFRKSAIKLLEKKQSEGYHIIIVSNAPKELIEGAAKRLSVNWHRAEINGKDKVVLSEYKYDTLFVCTDNISDMNLLDLAGECAIYVTKKTKTIFSQKYPDAEILEV